jgi:hypothetical protein
MKHGMVLIVTIVLILSVSCMNNRGVEKATTYVSVETINRQLSEKGLFLHFRDIIPPGEKKEYRGMFLTGYALSETEVSQHDYMLPVSADEPVLFGWDSVSWWDYLIRNLKDKDIIELLHYGYGDEFEKRPYVFDTDMLQPVKTGRADGFGLFNMNGHVREWCQDLHTLTGGNPTIQAHFIRGYKKKVHN